MSDILWEADAPAPPVEAKPFIPPMPVDGAGKYRGQVAQGYDAKREDSPKWIAEQAIIESMLDGLPSGAWILDIPCGTGRFIRAYEERKFCVWGVDISEDMLAKAAQKVTVKDNHIKFGLGDVRRLDGMWDKSVDCSIMCRLTRWLMEEPHRVRNEENCALGLRELGRVTRKRIILTARVRNHPFWCPYELILGSLPGWKIARDEPGKDNAGAVDENYRIIALEPA